MSWLQTSEDVSPSAAPALGLSRKAQPRRAPLKDVKQEEPPPRPSITDRQAKIRALALEIRSKSRQHQAEERDTKQEIDPQFEGGSASAAEARIEANLPNIEKKVLQCQDEVERVGILAAPLGMEALGSLQDLQLSAIRDTERAFKAAKLNLDLTSKELEKIRAEADVLKMNSSKDSLLARLFEIGDNLQVASLKLDEHKNVRRDYELAMQAEKVWNDLASRLAIVEMDCEKAVMMADPVVKAADVSGQELAATDMRETKEAIRIAQAKLAPTARLIAGKASVLQGHAKKKMEELQSRAESAQASLDKAQQKVDDAHSRAAAFPLLKQASERLAVVEQVIEKMRESEAPFLMGIENLPPEEAATALDNMDKAATSALSAVADAHKYVGLKLIEAGRLAEATAESAKVDLEKAKQQLDTNVAKVRKFQADISERRRHLVMAGMKEQVGFAEAAMQKLHGLAGALRISTVEKMSECLEQAQQAELQAQTAVTAARRELQDRQQEVRTSKNKVAALKSNSEVLRCKVRVGHMESELNKFRQLSQEVSEKIKVHASLRQIYEDVSNAESRVESMLPSAEAVEQAEDEQTILTLESDLTSTTTEVERKIPAASGLELKELRTLSERVQKAQMALKEVKDAAQERARSSFLSKLAEASAGVRELEKRLASVSSAATKPDELPINRLREALHEAQEAEKFSQEVQAQIADGQAAKIPLETKVELAKLQVRCKAARRKAKTASEALSSCHQRITSECKSAVRDALRSAAKRGEGAFHPEELFTELTHGRMELTKQDLFDFFDRHGMEVGLPEDKVHAAIEQFIPHSLTKQSFASLLADYQRVVREISLTDSVTIHAARKVRKLEIGEIVGIQSQIQKDQLGLERAMCHAIKDGAVGWVTVRTKGGISYLNPCEKPFLWCAQDVLLKPSVNDEEGLRELQTGECLELLEGPKEEHLGSEMRLRGVSCSEETSGWLQVRNQKGEVIAQEQSNVYKCIGPIAMTDVEDLGSCSMLRKIDVGEALELLQSEGSERRMFRACKDGAEGWVTITGNQGKTYLKPVAKHYVCLQASPVHAGLGEECGVLHVLMPGEAFMAFEDAKEVCGGRQRTIYKVRAVKDGIEGYVVTSGEVKPWNPCYKVLATVPLTQGLAANSTVDSIHIIRVLSPNELVDATEPAVEDSSTGQLRIRCIARQDLAMGWVTVRDATSVHLLPAVETEGLATSFSSKSAGKGGVVSQRTILKSDS